jgi:hypothetical protein
LRAVESRHVRAVDRRDERDGYERMKEVSRSSVVRPGTPSPDLHGDSADGGAVKVALSRSLSLAGAR